MYPEESFSILGKIILSGVPRFVNLKARQKLYLLDKKTLPINLDYPQSNIH